MNQTKLLVAVVLTLVVMMGLMFYNQQKSQQNQQDLIKALLENKAAPVEAAPTPTPEETKAAAEAALAAMRADTETVASAAELAELEALRAELDATREEKNLLVAENQRMQAEVDARVRRILAAPKLTEVTRVLGEHGLVVIAAGLSNNIEPGDEFSLRRGDQVVARIMITESIEADQAAASIIPGSVITTDVPGIGGAVVPGGMINIQEGDEVIQLD